MKAIKRVKRYRAEWSPLFSSQPMQKRFMAYINDTRSEQASDCQGGLYICLFRPADNSTAQLSMQPNMTEM